MELSSEFRRKRYPKDITPKVKVRKPKIIEVPEEPEECAISEEDTRKWAAIESTVCFTFNNLLKKVKTFLKKQYPHASVDMINYQLKESLKLFSINNQFFEYDAIPNTLGGLRWFILCPKCGKKSLKLFLPKLDDREPLYLCKDCHKLKPNSMLLCNNKKYAHITRPLSRMEKIKKQLLRKKNMNPEELEKLFKEYDRIEQRLITSPEYRLWMFKKEHGRTE